MAKQDWSVFINSIFFVLGFSLVFSLLGVLLQTLLAGSSLIVQTWLNRIGGIIIILFAIIMLDILPFSFLKKEFTFKVKKRIRYLSSFFFGASFAVAWTPCIGPVLGAVLTLAVAHPANAFFLLLAYSLGLGIPFLIVGFFINHANAWINRSEKVILVLRYVFALFLIFVGILVFTSQLSLIANIPFLSDLLISLNISSVTFQTTVTFGIAFLAGLVSFLSPCVLPLIPAYLTYLAATGVKK